ncbi:MAG: N-formylglutamate amidohydrolase [Aliishimia sp.]
MNHLQDTSENDLVMTFNPEGQSPVVVVCEHASCFIPPEYDNLGLATDALQSHAAWDPGALAVATGLATHLDATLVASGVSRLVYDCNRPPNAPDAMPKKSEVFDVPGNTGLTPAQRDDRTGRFYEPFRQTLSDVITTTQTPIIVTMHSFTPVYLGKVRSVEIGILHDTDTILADVLLQTASSHTTANVQRNEPYGPEHGVTHTLKEHAIEAGHLNVMLEIRNDMIVSQQQQDAMAKTLANWLVDAMDRLQTEGVAQCQA